MHTGRMQSHSNVQHDPTVRAARRFVVTAVYDFDIPARSPLRAVIELILRAKSSARSRVNFPPNLIKFTRALISAS